MQLGGVVISYDIGHVDEYQVNRIGEFCILSNILTYMYIDKYLLTFTNIGSREHSIWPLLT